MRLEQVIILAAGKGTRLGKTGKEKQKCSLILEYNFPIVSELFRKTTIVTGYRSHDIEKVVKKIKRKYKLKVDYVKQKEQLGQAHAVYLAKNKIHEGFDFCVVNGDIILKMKDFEEILATTIEAPLMFVSQVEDPWNYGIAILDEDKCIKEVIEKPPKGTRPCNLAKKGIFKALNGIYFFNYSVFKYIEQTKPNPKRNNEIFIADTLNIMVKQGETINTFEIENSKHLTTEKDLEKLERFLRQECK